MPNQIWQKKMASKDFAILKTLKTKVKQIQNKNGHPYPVSQINSVSVTANTEKENVNPTPRSINTNRLQIRPYNGWSISHKGHAPRIGSGRPNHPLQEFEETTKATKWSHLDKKNEKNFWPQDGPNHIAQPKNMSRAHWHTHQTLPKKPVELNIRKPKTSIKQGNQAQIAITGNLKKHKQYIKTE